MHCGQSPSIPESKSVLAEEGRRLSTIQEPNSPSLDSTAEHVDFPLEPLLKHTDPMRSHPIKSIPLPLGPSSSSSIQIPIRLKNPNPNPETQRPLSQASSEVKSVICSRDTSTLWHTPSTSPRLGSIVETSEDSSAPYYRSHSSYSYGHISATNSVSNAQQIFVREPGDCEQKINPLSKDFKSDSSDSYLYIQHHAKSKHKMTKTDDDTKVNANARAEFVWIWLDGIEFHSLETEEKWYLVDET